MKKITPIKNIWYDLLINYIPDPIRKIVGGLKELREKKPSKPETQKQSKEGKYNNIRNPFILKKLNYR